MSNKAPKPRKDAEEMPPEAMRAMWDDMEKEVLKDFPKEELAVLRLMFYSGGVAMFSFFKETLTSSIDNPELGLVILTRIGDETLELCHAASTEVFQRQNHD